MKKFRPENMLENFLLIAKQYFIEICCLNISFVFIVGFTSHLQFVF